MSYLEKLLDGVNVEWKSLGEVAKVGTGSSNGNEADENGKYPFFVRSQTIKTKDTFEYDEEAIIIPGEGGIGDIYHYINGKYALHQRVYRIHITTDFVDTRFIYYYMRAHFKSFIMLKAVSATVTSIRKPMIENFSVPIPCPENPKKSLEIQQKIIAILDTFTELTAELTAELTSRKMQYSYYREELLSFDKNKVKWQSLGEVGEIKRGVAFTKKQSIFGKFPVVANAADPITFHNEFNRNGEFIVIARSGANAGLISYWNEELFLTDAFSIHPNNSILNTKFAYYYLKSHQREIHLMKEGVGVPHVRASDFEIYNIPITSIEEQEHIVSILDKFDILTTSISEGLPKEIALRKQQYEYYRDLLLTFPKDNLES